MKFRRKFQVQASIGRVGEIHRCSVNLAAITPSPILVQVGYPPVVLAAGGEMAFSMWPGLLVLFAFKTWKTKQDEELKLAAKPSI